MKMKAIVFAAVLFAAAFAEARYHRYSGVVDDSGSNVLHINTNGAMRSTIAGENGSQLLVNTNGAIRSVVAGENGSALYVQEGGIMTIGYEHNQVHAGVTFRACHYFSALADNGVKVIAFNTRTNYAHLVAAVALSGKGALLMYEAPLITNSGTTNTSINMSRPMASVKTVQGVATYGAVATNYGTYLCADYIPGGTKQAGVGGEVRQGTEWVLTTNTWYLLVVSNASGGAVDGSVNLQWYEKGFASH